LTAGSAADLVRLSESIIQAGSKSFATASKLFDRETRASAYLLYAWCRHCDDVIDGQELGFKSAADAQHDPQHQIAELRRLTTDALDGKSMRDPVFAAFQRVAEKHAIPSRHAFELLDGFAMDVSGRSYATIDDTLSYCYHVAGVVGVMMAMVMGVRDDETLDRASDLGLAFQLTNIARDVTDDAKVGRIYLPRRWLDEAGIPPERLLDLRHRECLYHVVVRLLALADDYYESSRAGLARLPMRSRWAVATARHLYRQIGREVRRRGSRAWDSRVSASSAQKIAAVVIGGGTAITARMLGRFSPPPPRQGLWTRPRR
jgi:15-cis-phytoene synthase